jgi:hypothetical protein
VRAHRAPGKTEGHAAREYRRSRSDARDAPNEAGRGERRQGAQAREGGRSRQLRLKLEQEHAERETERGDSHDVRMRNLIRGVTSDDFGR